MPRLHATLIALLLGLAAVAGVAAASKTVRLGASTPAVRVAAVSAHAVAVRRAKLARWSRSLAKARAKRPPKLPSVPHFPAVPAPAAPVASAPVAAAPPAAAHVTYVRPKPVVVYKHAAPKSSSPGSGTQSSWSDDGQSGSDDGSQSSDGGGGD